MTAVTPTLNRGALARELGERVRGEVRFDAGARALYANDASIYRQLPLGLVVPRDADDVVTAVGVCRAYGAPVMARGSGTGLAGQSVNEAVAFDFSKYMHGVLDVDAAAGTARVQPGVICDHLRAAVAEHGLAFSVDPATHDRCTLGGMIGNNSCGTHSVRGGKTVDNVLSLDVVTYDGVRLTVGPTTRRDYERILAEGGRKAEIYRDLYALYRRYAERIKLRFPDIPRRVSGYNLDDLDPDKEFNLARALVGSESTCVFVLEATVRLLPRPQHTALLVAGYPDAAAAADHVPELMETEPMALECFDAGVLDNLGKHTPGLNGVGKRLAGLARERDVPRLARRTFRHWFHRHEGKPYGKPVLLWPDTFTNYFEPDVAIAAVHVLEDAGFMVRIPQRPLCCGRPLYDYGMLPTAKRWLRRTLDELREPISAGTPVMALEPSCLAVFRDEMRNLLPADEDARRLAAQSYTLAELLTAHGYQPPTVSRTALLQTHCHQDAVIGTAADAELMASMGLDVHRTDSGCCGMAGSFGYEEGDRYRVSIACGERAILPAVRAAGRETLLLADGFSCREQIAQTTGMRARHIAEVLGKPGGV